LIRILQSGWHPITSSEGMLGHARDVYAGAAGMAGVLRDALDGFDFRVVIYLRPQHKWVASAYTHACDAGATTSPEEFVASLVQQPNLNYTHFVSSLLDTLGRERLIVRAHTRFQDVVADFFTVAGLGPVPRYVQGTWANALSRDGVSSLPLREQKELRAVFAEDWPNLMALLRKVYGDLDPGFDQAYRIGSEWPILPTVEPHSQTSTSKSRRSIVGVARTRLSYLAAHGLREVRYRMRKRHLVGGR
jgi:hypothetical protein